MKFDFKRPRNSQHLGHSHYILRMTDPDGVFFFYVGEKKNKNKISWLADVGGKK